MLKDFDSSPEGPLRPLERRVGWRPLEDRPRLGSGRVFESGRLRSACGRMMCECGQRRMRAMSWIVRWGACAGGVVVDLPELSKRDEINQSLREGKEKV
jgi:hypothetical protein